MNEIKRINKKVILSERIGIKCNIAQKYLNHKVLGRLIKHWIRYLCPNPINVNSIEDFYCDYVSEARIAVYTVIIGRYDIIENPVFMPDNCDFFIVTDQDVPETCFWNKIPVNLKQFNLLDNSKVEVSRFYKMFPDKLFSDYQYSVYVDGNIKIMTDMTEFIQKMNPTGLKMHLHFRNDCVYTEIDRCLKIGKDSEILLDSHRKHLKEEGMPQKYGMLEAPIIVRQHHNPICKKIMGEWWNEFLNYSKRDQISLPFVLWRNNIQIHEIGTLGPDIYSNYAFYKVKHIPKL